MVQFRLHCEGQDDQHTHEIGCVQKLLLLPDKDTICEE